MVLCAGNLQKTGFANLNVALSARDSPLLPDTGGSPLPGVRIAASRGAAADSFPIMSPIMLAAELGSATASAPSTIAA